MPFDQITALTRLPALSVSQTAMVQPILDAALALAETYCDRRFMEQDEVEKVVPFAGNAIRVMRYPITSVASITGNTGGTLPTVP